MSATASPRMSPAEYLAWEREQPSKHQYLNGEVFAMSGGSFRHNHLSANVVAHLATPSCRVFTSDQKVFIPSTTNYVYPDATVVCGALQAQAGTNDVLENPRVVVEVLSKSTEKHDRGDKWEDYQSIASLTDYVIVAQRAARIEHFTRQADGAWTYRVAGPGERLTLSTGAALVVDEIYSGAFELPGDEQS